MKMYAAHGITEFVLCLGYKSWVIKEFFLNYRAMTSDVVVTLGKHHAVEVKGGGEEDWKVILAETGEDTMTGGRVAAIRKYVEDDELFCLTYGDGVSDVDVTSLLAFHRAHGKACTVTAVRPPGRFGEMRLSRRDGLRIQREAPGDRGLHQRRLLRLRQQAHLGRAPDEQETDARAGADAAAVREARAAGLPAPRLLAADGHACASSSCSTICGRWARRPGRPGRTGREAHHCRVARPPTPASGCSSPGTPASRAPG